MPVFRRLVRAGHHYNKLSARIVHGEVWNYFIELSAHRFLEAFGNLPRDGCTPLWPEHFGQLCERLQQSVGRLVEDQRTSFLAQSLEARLPTFLWRQETLETETIGRQTGDDKRRHESGGAGQAFHFYALGNACADEQKAGIGDSGCAGVGDEGDVFASLHAFDELRRGAMFVEGVVRL